MRCHNRGNIGYLLIAIVPFLATVSLCNVKLAFAQSSVHRNGFESKQPFWLSSENNVKYEEKSHSVTDAFAHRGTYSEQIILNCDQGKNDNNFIFYTYKTPQAPISEELTASVYIRGSKQGVQLLARAVLPRERDPQNLGEPLTVFLVGDTLKHVRSWQRLDLPRPRKLLQEQQQKLRQELKKDIDLTDAYIDRLILNLYTGPGTVEVQIDDLEISPVVAPNVAAPTLNGEKSTAMPDLPKGHVSPPGSGSTVPLVTPTRNPKGMQVRFEGGKIRIDGQPFFPRVIRYSGGGNLKELKDKGFNTLFLDGDTDQKVIDEAVGNGLWLIPRMPLLGDSKPANQLTSRQANSDLPVANTNSTEALTAALTKYSRGDGVLAYDLGPGRSSEQISLVSRTAAAIRASDPSRPRSVDVWDGARRYSTQVEMISLHRNPLLTSLELTSHRDFLMQRTLLAGEGVFTWSWVQTHVPDWQVKLLYGRDNVNDLNEGFNPTPEQIRILTYLSIACGAKGIGYWSDRFLTDVRHGKERLLMMALLNQELTMLEPVLQSIRTAPTWHDVPGKPDVKFAVLRGERGILVIPVWLGAGSQFVPAQGAVGDLTIVVPLVPTNMAIWEITPGRVQSLQLNSKEVVGGTKVVIPEFDLTTAIVFTNDQEQNGLVARWQDYSQRVTRQAAEWAVELADLEFERVKKQHADLEGVAPALDLAAGLLIQAQNRLDSARSLLTQKKDELAYQESMRVLRPLRALMRAQWETAVKRLDFASASPYAVSYQTLPQHYRLESRLGELSLGANLLRDGDFEGKSRQVFSKPNGDEVELPQGWSVQQATLDSVDLEAGLIDSKIAKVTLPPKKPEPKRDIYRPSSMSRIPEKSDPLQPDLGESCLRLMVTAKDVNTPSGKKMYAPSLLDRTFLAVHSPPVRVQPGTWVRISGWYYIAQPLRGSADGLLIYDSAGGESLGVRATDITQGWKQFRLYRRVPDSGTIWVSMVLTAMGQAFIDDLKIEPYLNTPPEK